MSPQKYLLTSYEFSAMSSIERMLGVDTGNPAADYEAEMWLMGLIGVLVAAIPIAVLSPSLGFKKRRRREAQMNLVSQVLKAID